MQSPRPQPSKSQRVLACVLCQQRKVKCDRGFPCSNCTKQQAKCVPATQVRRRKRRFPERDLLGRLREYEGLLRRSNIKFDPLHTDPMALNKDFPGESSESDEEQADDQRPGLPSPSTSQKTEILQGAKNIWQAMGHGIRHSSNESFSLSDVVHGVATETVVNRAWDQMQPFDGNSYMLLGSHKTVVGLFTFHPEPAHIFRLWQVYLDNVNPLLKVTHTPSVQRRITEAVGNMQNISSTLEALMFGIYSISTLSLAEEDCQAIFGWNKKDLLTKYQFGCQQALLNCGFLRSSDRDCLTALFLFLVSMYSSVDPQSLASMLGVAIRIAQRMGLQNESASVKCTAFEAEMRRRVWWALMLFDDRISEMSDYNKTTTLSPVWDCKVLLNVDDSELRAEMKEPPAAQGKLTESLFAVVRSILGDFVRHTHFHLDFTYPALKQIAKPLSNGGNLSSLEKTIEEDYLRLCDPENPLHFMTLWTTRLYVSKCRLTQHYSTCYSPSVQQTETERDNALSYALNMLECDTKIATSPLTKGYLWFLHLYFPFPAYIHIVQDLRKRAVSKRTEHMLAWEVMSDNYEARFDSKCAIEDSRYITFVNIILQAWGDVEAAFKASGEDLALPRIVANIKRRAAEKGQRSQQINTEQSGNVETGNIDDFLFSMPIAFANPSLPYGIGVQGSFQGTESRIYAGVPDQVSIAPGDNQSNWVSMPWSLR